MPKRPLGSSQGGKSLATAKRARYARTYKGHLRPRKSAVSVSRQIAPITKHPFPREWRTKITWDPSTALLSPGAVSGAFVVALNDLYDPDYSNVLGNNQPLFTDQIISATGPYQNYRVDGWKCKITVSNVSPVTSGGSPMAIDMYSMQGSTNAVDVDTFSELQSSPGVVTHLLGNTNNGSKSYHTWYMNGRTSAYIPTGSSKDQDYCGAYNASPAKRLFLGVGYRNADVTDTAYPKIFVKFEMELDVVFFARDAVIS